MCYSQYCPSCNTLIASCEEEVIKINARLYHHWHYPVLKTLGIDSSHLKELKETFDRPPTLDEVLNFAFTQALQIEPDTMVPHKTKKALISYVATNLGTNIDIGTCVMWMGDPRMKPIFSESKKINEKILTEIHQDLKFYFLRSNWQKFFYGLQLS